MQTWTERVTLRHVATHPQIVRLREPRGADELALAGVDTRAGVQWLDGLLDNAPFHAAELSASDRDALFAAQHRALWGDRIVSAIHCAACDAMFDLSFELSTLQWQLHERASEARVEAARILIDDTSGARLRLPGADDEDAAAQLGIEAGCAHLLAGISDGDADGANALSVRLEALAPLIDVDLETQCAECGHAHIVRFDLQSFVLQRLLDERDIVLGEVHALASGYGWPLQEIGSLPRSLRHALAERLSASA